MISRDNYTKDHILEIRKQSGADPSIIERTIFAFGLLEAIQRVGLPFVFKGGTSLMLILSRPMRLSTDIDIVVEPGTDVDYYVEKAKEIFPFHGMKEDIRFGANKIEKRHFRFLFKSPLTGKDIHILLDVVFENVQYAKINEQAVENDMLLTVGESISVLTPDINCILGDKLTAFAPHTTGIHFDQNKDLEIVKQFVDCWSLCREMDELKIVSETFERTVQIETGYRGSDATPSDVLRDIIEACICLMGRGNIRPEEYAHFHAGIGGIQGHLFSGRINGENAGLRACEVMYLAACIRAGHTKFRRIEEPEKYKTEKLTLKNSKKITYVRNVDLQAYGYLVEALRLSDDIDIQQR